MQAVVSGSDGLDSLFDDIFGEGGAEEEPVNEQTEPVYSGTEEETDDASDGFDILSYLASSFAEEDENESPIERMEENGETVITISLDELMKYNLKMKQKG